METSKSKATAKQKAACVHCGWFEEKHILGAVSTKTALYSHFAGRNSSLLECVTRDICPGYQRESEGKFKKMLRKFFFKNKLAQIEKDKHKDYA